MEWRGDDEMYDWGRMGAGGGVGFDFDGNYSFASGHLVQRLVRYSLVVQRVAYRVSSVVERSVRRSEQGRKKSRTET